METINSNRVAQCRLEDFTPVLKIVEENILRHFNRINDILDINYDEIDRLSGYVELSILELRDITKKYTSEALIKKQEAKILELEGKVDKYKMILEIKVMENRVERGIADSTQIVLDDGADTPTVSRLKSGFEKVVDQNRNYDDKQAA